MSSKKTPNDRVDHYKTEGESFSRRDFLVSSCKLCAIAAVSSSHHRASAAAPVQNAIHRASPRVVVVGAGAFGGWTALYLLRSGAHVTLVDSWGPGNSRSSSGGETRVIRGTYGSQLIYTEMAARALALWKENESRWHRQLFHHTGVLWMVGSDEQFERAALPVLSKAGWKYETLTPTDLERRYSQINFDGVKWAIFESESGYLKARESCRMVVEAFQSEGGAFLEAAVRLPRMSAGELGLVSLSNGATLTADYFVFACGPWLGELFPDVIGGRIRPTRQEVFFFGAPAGDTRFCKGHFPVWADRQDRLRYGIPANDGRGFKVADDTRGPAFDPTQGDRVVSAESLVAIREYVNHRFPALKNAPLIESRICQYENSPDGNFVVDRHPSAQNVWLVGGGSGHGFKHGPALGELVSSLVLGSRPAPSEFLLSRFTK